MATVKSLFYKGSNNVQFIGIWGMGGIGKTTLAKALFNKLCFAYEGFCFLANLREESKKYGIDTLKKKLILRLLRHKKSHIGIVDAISPYAMSRLGWEKSFNALDDVDDHEQLEHLAGRHDWFGLGSKILITTRDKQVLGRKVDGIYKLEALNSNEAFQLFSLNAFRKDCSDPKVRMLAMDVTYYGNGNPLALKGSEANEGITLNVSEVEDMCPSLQAFCLMPNLSQTIALGRISLKSLPTTFKVENLIEIGMPNGNLTKLWKEVQVRASEVLWLKDCSNLSELPDNIRLLTSLRVLELSRTNIETLPLSIKHLSSLHDIYLDGCKKLQSLPELPPSLLTLSTRSCRLLRTLDLSLMNEGEEGNKVDYDDDDPFPYFRFTNCMNLDEQSIKAVEAKVLLEINKAIYGIAIMEYPGTRVPKWFMYRTTKYLVTVDLSSIPQPWYDSSIFRAVTSRSPPGTCIDATWYIDGEYACWAESSFGTDEFTLSDHVFLWYDQYSFGAIQRKIGEKKKGAQYNTYYPLLEIEFTARCWKSSYCGKIGEIKQFGVCPTSAFEYQN
ncbi:disease resistance protein RML1B-like [Neltuma alba]|uniref:disease resistance protein RML1B-like n=1 Tax=Neltuma alba TaxID=207710 RepID=UPI0010A31DA8|nr:disease resistance protein RML1B-like [Prosopis alba]